jgi:hypothetical protein
MGVRRSVTESAVSEAAKRAAPVVASTPAVKAFLDRAIDGMPQWPGARVVANRALERTGTVEAAVKSVIEQHLRLAGVQGFLTSLGGLVAMPLTMPANMAGLFLLQLRMTAAVAHLRGFDVDDPRVRLASLAALLGEDEVAELVRSGVLPGPPGDLVGRRSPDPAEADRLIKQVVQSLAARVAGKRVTVAVARRVPGLGGVVGAGVDAVNTYRVGRYADDQLANAPTGTTYVVERG